MSPRIVLKLNARFQASLQYQPLLSDRPMHRLLQQKLPIIFRRSRWAGVDETVKFWAELQVPASEIQTVLSRAKWIEGPDAMYRMGEISYIADDNTYVVDIDYAETVKHDRMLQHLNKEMQTGVLVGVHHANSALVAQSSLDDLLNRQFSKLDKFYQRSYPQRKIQTYRELSA